MAQFGESRKIARKKNLCENICFKKIISKGFQAWILKKSDNALALDLH